MNRAAGTGTSVLKWDAGIASGNAHLRTHNFTLQRHSEFHLFEQGVREQIRAFFGVWSVNITP